MKSLITYKYRLRPTKAQEQTLLNWIGTCRFVYNTAKDIREQTYKKLGTSISAYDLNKQLVGAKQQAEWIKNVPSQVLQDAVFRMDTAFKNFWKGKAKYPKWARKASYKSLTFPQGLRIESNKIKFPKLGFVKAIIHRPLEGKIKTSTITQRSGKWYVCITTEIEKRILPSNDNAIGIDSGIAQSYTISDGQVFDLPNMVVWRKKLRIAQRKLSRQKKGSNKRDRTKKIISQIHEKISNIRLDFLHKTSTTLIRENQAIFVENLKVKNMSKSAKGSIEAHGKMVKQKSGLNREILNQGWGKFFTMLEYKSKLYGRTFEKVSPTYTSQTCGTCGHVSKDNRKTQSQFVCVNCGYTANADFNAANNIQRLGLSLQELTQDISPYVSCEVSSL